MVHVITRFLETVVCSSDPEDGAVVTMTRGAVVTVARLFLIQMDALIAFPCALENNCCCTQCFLHTISVLTILSFTHLFQVVQHPQL